MKSLVKKFFSKSVSGYTTKSGAHCYNERNEIKNESIERPCSTSTKVEVMVSESTQRTRSSGDTVAW
jgi:hypothetical protein